MWTSTIPQEDNWTTLDWNKSGHIYITLCAQKDSPKHTCCTKHKTMSHEECVGAWGLWRKGIDILMEDGLSIHQSLCVIGNICLGKKIWKYIWLWWASINYGIYLLWKQSKYNSCKLIHWEIIIICLPTLFQLLLLLKKLSCKIILGCSPKRFPACLEW